jgi:ankyrin repeat protein
MEASCKGFHEVVKLILDRGQGHIDQGDKNGRTALMYVGPRVTFREEERKTF